MPNESVDSILKQAERHLHNAIACRISVDGLVAAVSEEADEAIGVGVGSGSDGDFTTGSFDADAYADDGRTLYAEHLRIRPGGGGGSLGEGVWFASAATAYGTTSQTVLWSYVVPGEVLGFARRETVPCGVLELLGFVDGSQTPTWDSGDASGEHGVGAEEAGSRGTARPASSSSSAATLTASSLSRPRAACPLPRGRPPPL